jgi:hypothetical protein
MLSAGHGVSRGGPGVMRVLVVVLGSLGSVALLTVFVMLLERL